MTDPRRKARLINKRVYLRVRVLVDPKTGEETKALVPRFGCDRQLLADRGFKAGDTLRAEITKPRDLGQWRKAHLLAGLVRQHIPGFELLTSHEAIKRLQLESGVACDEDSVTVPGVGTLLRKVPRSLAFDEMEETEFMRFFQSICHHMAQTYWPHMAREDVEQMIELMPPEPAAPEDHA